MDKFFLLTYTYIGHDEMRHMGHAWFETEQNMREFVETMCRDGKEPEVDLALEILSYREIKL